MPKHDWDYTGSEPLCSACGLTKSQNPCQHESVTPPNFGFFKCNDCGMSFSEHPRDARARQEQKS